MAWTEITRSKYERKTERYQSDLTDVEWALIDPHLHGWPRKWTLREIVDARGVGMFGSYPIRPSTPSKTGP